MQYLRLPKERVGVLIGRDGEIKKYIEERTGIKLIIDSEGGDVNLNEEKCIEPVFALKVRDIVRAIGRGFSPEIAFRLFEDENFFELIEIKEYSGKSEKDKSRLKARIIGTKGKTKKTIENLTGADIVIYGDTVGIIGNEIELNIARNAIEMLLRGSEHYSVYKFLERNRARIKIAKSGF